jgi:hypothetical protein
MKTKTLLYGGVAAGGGAAVLRRLLSPDRSTDSDGHHNGHATDRWHFVTINRSPEDVQPGGRLPDPLARIADLVEVKVRPAPADKGTELGARLRGPVPTGPAEVAARTAGRDPRQAVRAALRETQWLLEAGEVLQPDPHPSTHTTLTNLPLKLATIRARGEGRL